MAGVLEDSEIGSVLERTVPWESYSSAKLISDSDLQLIRKYDKRPKELRASMLEQVGLTLGQRGMLRAEQPRKSALWYSAGWACFRACLPCCTPRCVQRGHCAVYIGSAAPNASRWALFFLAACASDGPGAVLYNCNSNLLCLSATTQRTRPAHRSSMSTQASLKAHQTQSQAIHSSYFSGDLQT